MTMTIFDFTITYGGSTCKPILQFLITECRHEVHGDKSPDQKLLKLEDKINRKKFILKVKEEYELLGKVTIRYDGKSIEERNTALCDIILPGGATLDPKSGKLDVMVDTSVTVANGGRGKGGKASGDSKAKAYGGTAGGGTIKDNAVQGGDGQGGDAQGKVATAGQGEGGSVNAGKTGNQSMEVAAGDAIGGCAQYSDSETEDDA